MREGAQKKDSVYENNFMFSSLYFAKLPTYSIVINYILRDSEFKFMDLNLWIASRPFIAHEPEIPHPWTNVCKSFGSTPFNFRSVSYWSVSQYDIIVLAKG